MGVPGGTKEDTLVKELLQRCGVRVLLLGPSEGWSNCSRGRVYLFPRHLGAQTGREQGRNVSTSVSLPRSPVFCWFCSLPEAKAEDPEQGHQ